jgi:putative membrane protein
VVTLIRYPRVGAVNGRCRIVRVIRFLIRTVIVLVANAVGLLVAASLLEGMQLDAGGFVVAVVVFTIVFALMQPFLASQFQRRGSAALGGVSLIASLIALIVTDLVSDGLSIDGVGAWVGAAVIVWAASLLAAFILPFLGLRRFLEERRD